VRNKTPEINYEIKIIQQFFKWINNILV
jgi:hypothetical protein